MNIYIYIYIYYIYILLLSTDRIEDEKFVVKDVEYINNAE